MNEDSIKKGNLIVGRHQFKRGIYRLYYTVFCATIWVKISIQFWRRVLFVVLHWYKEYNERNRCLWAFFRRFDWLFLDQQATESNQIKKKSISQYFEYLDKLDDAIGDSISDSHRDEYVNVNEYSRTIMYFLFWRIINLITRDGGRQRNFKR